MYIPSINKFMGNINVFVQLNFLEEKMLRKKQTKLSRCYLEEFHCVVVLYNVPWENSEILAFKMPATSPKWLRESQNALVLRWISPENPPILSLFSKKGGCSPITLKNYNASHFKSFWGYDVIMYMHICNIHQEWIL